MITLLAAVMVLASAGVVAWPLLRGIGGRNRPRLVEDVEVSELLAQKDAALFAISELEADHEMGNLSLSDYQELRQKYEHKAVALIKTVDELRSERGLEAAGNLDEEIEARVAELRAKKGAAGPEIEAPVTAGGTKCPQCSAAVRAGDLFCNRCGAALSATCPGCSAAVGPDDRFCSRCGTTLNKGGNREAR